MEDELKKRLQSLEDFLNPDVTRSLLMLAAIYIAAFDTLKSSITDHPVSLFADRWNADRPAPSEEYQRVVLSLNKSPVYASLYFLRDHFHAIDEDDISAFERIKKCRNELAHRLLNMLVADGLPREFASCFTEMAALIRKIERWWFANVEMALNDDIPPGTDPGTAISGPELMLQLLTHIALSPDKESREFLEAFRKLRQKRGLP